MQKSFNKLSYLELIIIIMIFILSFITFNYLFSVTKTGSYYQSVISALIGTLLTVTITALILKKQVKGEELKNQNIEVFKKKVENYENFTRLIVKSLADRRINEDEANELRSAIYNLALFSSEKTIEVLSKFIRNHIIADEEDIETGFFTIISQFRKDLKLEGIDEFAANKIEVIESLLESGFENIGIFKEISSFFYNLRTTISERLEDAVEEDIFKKFKIGKIEGCYDKIYLEITNEDSGLFMYTVSITYPNTRQIEKLEVELVANNLIEGEKVTIKLFKKEVEKIHKRALEARFSHASLEEKKDFTPHYHKKYPVNFQKAGRNITISEKSLYRKLVADILTLELFGKDE